MDGFVKAVVTLKAHCKSKKILEDLLRYILFVLQKLACYFEIGIHSLSTFQNTFFPEKYDKSSSEKQVSSFLKEK